MATRYPFRCHRHNQRIVGGTGSMACHTEDERTILTTRQCQPHCSFAGPPGAFAGAGPPVKARCGRWRVIRWSAARPRGRGSWRHMVSRLTVAVCLFAAELLHQLAVGRSEPPRAAGAVCSRLSLATIGSGCGRQLGRASMSRRSRSRARWGRGVGRRRGGQSGVDGSRCGRRGRCVRRGWASLGRWRGRG